MFPLKTQRIDDEYVMVDKPYSLDKYMGYQVNVILFQWLKNNKKLLLDPRTDINKSDIFFASDLTTHKIFSIFKAVVFPLENVKPLKRYLTLDEALNVLEKSKIYCHKIVIPIIVLKRKHFRLLVIDLDLQKATFYDSKAKPVGVLCEAASSSSLKDYRYVQSTCSKYFKSIYYEEAQLGHQGVFNDQDCGPYTIEYAIRVLSGVSLSLKIDIDLVRAKHEELFQLHLQPLISPKIKLSPFQYQLFYQQKESTPKKEINEVKKESYLAS